MVFGRVPHLLDACVHNGATAVRTLRLVNKDLSVVALQALRSYTLTLEGGGMDTNVEGASLLQKTQLQRLNIKLLLSGMWV